MKRPAYFAALIPAILLMGIALVSFQPTSMVRAQAGESGTPTPVATLQVYETPVPKPPTPAPTSVPDKKEETKDKDKGTGWKLVDDLINEAIDLKSAILGETPKIEYPDFVNWWLIIVGGLCVMVAGWTTAKKWIESPGSWAALVPLLSWGLIAVIVWITPQMVPIFFKIRDDFYPAELTSANLFGNLGITLKNFNPKLEEMGGAYFVIWFLGQVIPAWGKILVIVAPFAVIVGALGAMIWQLKGDMPGAIMKVMRLPFYWMGSFIGMLVYINWIGQSLLTKNTGMQFTLEALVLLVLALALPLGFAEAAHYYFVRKPIEDGPDGKGKKRDTKDKERKAGGIGKVIALGYAGQRLNETLKKDREAKDQAEKKERDDALRKRDSAESRASARRSDAERRQQEVDRLNREILRKQEEAEKARNDNRPTDAAYIDADIRKLQSQLAEAEQRVTDSNELAKTAEEEARKFRERAARFEEDENQDTTTRRNRPVNNDDDNDSGTGPGPTGPSPHDEPPIPQAPSPDRAARMDVTADAVGGEAANPNMTSLLSRMEIPEVAGEAATATTSVVSTTASTAASAAAAVI